jgi:hypothetical protein
MLKQIANKQCRGTAGVISVLAEFITLNADTIELTNFRFHRQDNFLTIRAFINFAIKKSRAVY